MKSKFVDVDNFEAVMGRVAASEFKAHTPIVNRRAT